MQTSANLGLIGHGMMALPVPQILTLVLCILAASSDLLARRVPNALLTAIALLNLAWLIAMTVTGDLPAWPGDLAGHALGALIGLAAFLPFWLKRRMGAGDVKLFSLFGFLMGWQALLPIWIVGSIMAGMHALAILLLRHQPMMIAASARLAAQPWYLWLAQQRQGRSGIPYAAYLAVGAVMMVAMR